MTQWATVCYGEDKGFAHVQKGLTKFRSGRAVHVLIFVKPGWIFISVKVGKSYKPGEHNVTLTFQGQVGRDAVPDRRLQRASCPHCTAGANHGGCSHVFTALALLVHLQAGQMMCGDVGDGEKGWGTSGVQHAVPVQTTKAISVLVDGGKLAAFTGIRAGAPPFPSDLISRYISEFQRRAHPDIPASIVEIHANSEIVRHGQPLTSSAPDTPYPGPPTSPRKARRGTPKRK